MNLLIAVIMSIMGVGYGFILFIDYMHNKVFDGIEECNDFDDS